MVPSVNTKPLARGVIAVLAAAVAASCAGLAPQREAIEAVRDLSPPLPKGILLEVECAGDPLRTYGSVPEWEEDLSWLLFDDLRVSEDVWCGGGAASADLILRLFVRPVEPEAPRVSAQAAVVDFLSWSAIPVLPLWINDVEVDPGLEVRLALSRPGTTALEGTLPGQKVLTSMRDRYPFLSWQTPGVLVAPPFAYRSGDPEHLAESIAGDVRLAVAIEAARFIKERGFDPERELIRSIEARPTATHWEITVVARSSVGRLSFRVGGDPTPRWIEPVSGDMDGDAPGTGGPLVVRIPREQIDGAEVLRIEAISRLRNEGRATYTVLLRGRPGDEALREASP